MRTFVLVLMVALLPLRMWAAEAMAVGMAQEEVAAAAKGAMAAMPADCPMMAAAAADTGHGPGDEMPQDASHCVVCHLCAASACLPVSALKHGPARAERPATGPSRYASAELPRALRPPIA